MKTYAYLIILCFISIFSSCRTNMQRSTTTDSKLLVNQSETLHQQSTGTIASTIQASRDINQDWYRITRTYNTNQPIDPQTGLYPLQNETIEGSKKTETFNQEDNHTIQLSDSISKGKDTQLTNEEKTLAERKNQTEIIPGIAEGISSGISLVVGILMLILGIYTYVWLRKKNPSK